MARVLIIDDDEGLREMLGRTFTAHGHTVDLAEDGKYAIEKAPLLRPDVVITDIWMPKREGLETVRFFRKSAPEARIIVMSGRPVVADVSLFKIARALGADAFLTKPFGMEEIIRTVEELLANGRKPSGKSSDPL